MTFLNLASRRPARVAFWVGGQLADCLAEVPVASACRRPASHAPPAMQPAPSTSGAPMRRLLCRR
jgi:hypothetical protein